MIAPHVCDVVSNIYTNGMKLNSFAFVEHKLI